MNMTAKELLQKIVLGDITVAQGLMLSKVMYGNILSEKSYRWICNELEYYEAVESLPEYRVVNCVVKAVVRGPYSSTRIETLDTSYFNRPSKNNKPFASPNKINTPGYRVNRTILGKNRF